MPRLEGALSEPQPKVFAVRRAETLWRSDKRGILKTAAVGAAASVVGGCSPSRDKNPKDKDPVPPVVPPFSIGGVTYSLIKLPDYNAKIPSSGKGAVVIAFVGSDYYLREFGPNGTMTVNYHESKVKDKTALGDLKQVVQSVVTEGGAAPAKQQEIADLFQASVRPSANAAERKRMQGSEAKAEPAGRRMQGAVSSGNVSGRRMQGAEGRADVPGVQRDLGTLNINQNDYNDAKIVETYTDGYTKISHAGGSAVVRTDALPEVVQMQLPHPIANPSPKPSAIPSTTTRSTTVPSSSSPPSTRSSGGHYWRPN